MQDQQECTGVRVSEDLDLCIAHVNPQQRQEILAGGSPQNLLRGVTVDKALLDELIERRELDYFDATNATFTEDVNFRGVKFYGPTAFGGAIFKGFADFRLATFEHHPIGESSDAVFAGVEFRAGVNFQRAKFAGRAMFKKVQFGVEGKAGDAIFEEVEFGEVAGFVGAEFFGVGNFKDTRYAGEAVFDGIRAESSVMFDRAEFASLVDITQATVRDGLSFTEARFEKDVRWRTFRVYGNFSLMSASFAKRMYAEFLCRRLHAERSSWNEGAHLEFACGDVFLDQASFAKPALLSFSNEEWEHGGEIPRASAPRLVSVRGANLEKVTLSGLDLGACRFRGAHNIDKLRIEGKKAFSATPSGFRWTNRIAIAEEHRWRKRTERGKRQEGWFGNDQQSYQGEPIYEAPPPSPHELAETYRLLRKGREDAKDEPGATDFYYGEMEMRRATAKARRRDAGFKRPSEWLSAFIEWLVLLVYWFVSGYGTRPWRALTVFAALIVLSSFAFHVWGFMPDENFAGTWPQGVLFALESATSLLRPASRPLNGTGELLMLVLRYVGPILLALAALALRSRVKR
ncbi:pentapeptide repeat-containing protein [Kibdelosporangium lantanae]|uniref:Pentapeptide repeat-containing protein n=1 Tax=Kibdelosporangium lantanae TaxID=1497396 RepID=A0ABW3M6W6_9PSEU